MDLRCTTHAPTHCERSSCSSKFTKGPVWSAKTSGQRSYITSRNSIRRVSLNRSRGPPEPAIRAEGARTIPFDGMCRSPGFLRLPVPSAITLGLPMPSRSDLHPPRCQRVTLVLFPALRCCLPGIPSHGSMNLPTPSLYSRDQNNCRPAAS